MNRLLVWASKAGLNVPGKGQKAEPQGYVDGFGPKFMWGWAAWQGENPPQVTVLCDGQEFPLFARWKSRPDLAGTKWQNLVTPGFHAYLSRELTAALAANPALVETMTVRAGEHALPFSAKAAVVAPEPGDSNHFPQGFTVSLAGSLVQAEAWDQPFRVVLRLDSDDSTPDVRLACNGALLDCPVTRTDVGPTAERPKGLVTFEFELPGAVWKSLADTDTDADSGSLHFSFVAGDLVFPEVPFALPASRVNAWLLKQAGDDHQDTYNQMLALEHLHFLGSRISLDKVAREYVVTVARDYSLASYVSLAVSVDEAVAVNARPRAFWQLVRQFNDELPQWSGREAELLEKLGKGLQPAIHSEFVEHVAPFFLRIDRFDVIQPYIPLARAEELAGWADTFTVSMSLPFFIASGQVERATQILYSLSEKKGWLSTDALAAASALLARQSQAFPDHEKFVYGLISLIDGLSADYFSRHQDLQLGRALAVWLEQPALLSDWLRRDVLSAVIRNYGFSVEFWSRESGLLAADEPLLLSLRQAHTHFLALQSVVDNWQPDAPIPVAALDALAYFRRVGNHDQARVLRELICGRLLAARDTDAAALGLPLQDMLALADEETVRLAALPVADDRGLLQQLPSLRPLLVAMQGGISRAGHYPLQCHLGRALREFEAGAVAQVNAQLPALLREIDTLAAGGNNYLAADVLARLLLLAVRGNDISAMSLSLALSRQLEEGIRSGAAWPYQPLLAACAVLRRVVGQMPALQAQAQQVASVLNAQYGDGRLTAIEQALAIPRQLLLKAPPGRDTLVVVYSCRKYLDTRVQAMRDSWLQDLQAREIPFVVLVGDGDDTFDGDVLALNVSDRYEDLPAKTLAMIRWVSEHTDFQYLLKIDDDCLLNVDEYFDSLSYRKFHYYGRLIQRLVGGTDRKWHQEKSQGERARLALDKSPEPSLYADGGGGYVLSRLAMTRVLAQSATAWGRRLIACSFMEDKLVGDLLAADGIRVANEDYYALIRRRFGPDATPVAIWDNTFLPSAWTPTKFAHLDTASAMRPVRDGIREESLRPCKLWPCYSRPSLWYNYHQLELLTAVADVRRLNAEDLFVVAVMRNEITMAPHFLAHYRRQGIRAFVIVDNVSDDGTREYLLAQPDVILYSADSEYGMSTYGVAWQQTVLAHHCLGKWALVADADEFLVYPDCETTPLRDFVAGVGAAGYDAVRVDMVDMYPFGDLADADFTKADPFTVAPWFDNPPLEPRWLVNGYYGNAPNYVSALRHRQMPFAEPDDFTAQKYCLVRYAPWMRFPAGLHNVANARIAPETLVFAHFKYHAGFKAKVEEEVARKQHFGGAKEYRKYLAMLAEGKGGFGREEISARYAGSAGFLAAAHGGSASGAA